MVEEAEDEQSWIARSRNGDHEAFEALVRRYQTMIHALTYRMTGSLSDAEDLAQETFIAAFRQLKSFRGDAQFSSWLYRIGTNRCLNWIRSGQRRQRAHADWERDAMLQTSDAVDDSRAQQIQDALMALDAKQRAAVVLTTYDGLSHAEAARVVGCSETTVSWRVWAARRKLRRSLEALTRKGDK